MAEEELRRSVVCRHRVRLQVTNRFPGPVSLVWRDYAGGRQEFAVLQPAARYDVTTFGSHPWEASHAVPGGETVYFLWSPAARRPYLEAYRLLQLRRQERLLTRPQLDSALEGVLPLAVTLVPRYTQPAALRAAVLRALAGRLPGAGAVPALGLPRPLQEELQALL